MNEDTEGLEYLRKCAARAAEGDAVSIELPPLYGTAHGVAHEAVEARERILLARIAALEAERDAAREEADRRTRQVEATYLVQKRLTEERDAARADAERYRWLRSRVPGSAYRIMGVIYSEGGEGVDAAIDKARSKE